MVTLTGFLLARIAEDEAVARGVLTEWEKGASPATRVPLQSTDGPGFQVLAALPDRVLAECEAKRQIVKAALDVDDEKDYGNTDNMDDGQVWAFGITLRALALPYADHPDFDPAWRA